MAALHTSLCLACPASHFCHLLFTFVAVAVTGQGGLGGGPFYGNWALKNCQAFPTLSPKVTLTTKLQLSCASVCHPCAHLLFSMAALHTSLCLACPASHFCHLLFTFVAVAVTGPNQTKFSGSSSIVVDSGLCHPFGCLRNFSTVGQISVHSRR